LLASIAVEALWMEVDLSYFDQEFSWINDFVTRSTFVQELFLVARLAIRGFILLAVLFIL